MRRMAVRTRLLALMNSLPVGGASTVLLVAPDRTAVIRHWSVYNGTAEARTVTVQVRSNGMSAVVARRDALPVGEVLAVTDANIALGPGEELRVSVAGSGSTVSMHVAVCGSLLEGAPE